MCSKSRPDGQRRLPGASGPPGVFFNLLEDPWKVAFPQSGTQIAGLKLGGELEESLYS